MQNPCVECIITVRTSKSMFSHNPDLAVAWRLNCQIWQFQTFVSSSSLIVLPAQHDSHSLKVSQNSSIDCFYILTCYIYSIYRLNQARPAGLPFATAGLQQGPIPHCWMLIGLDRRLERLEGVLADADRG